MHNYQSEAPTAMILNLKQLLKIMGGMSKATVYERMNPSSPRYDEHFPRPFKMTTRRDGKSATNGWLASDVQAYIELLASQRNPAL